jgi:hypothetical protein
MNADLVSTFTAIAMGIALSAACGFRVFLPLLAASVAAHFGRVTLAPSWQWVGSVPAMVTLATATVIETAGYYIPWVDHALDFIAAPAAVVAGTLLTGSLLVHVDPLMKWSLAVIAGGGAAGSVQALTMAVRGASTATTGGLANPIVSTVESVGAIVLSVLAILVPVLAVLIVFAALTVTARLLLRVAKRRKLAAMAGGQAQ